MITKTDRGKQCTLSAGHFDSNGGATVQYEAHLLIKDVQGYTKSHWTPQLGDYLLRIAPAATMVSMTVKVCYNAQVLLAILMAMVMHRYHTTRITK